MLLLLLLGEDLWALAGRRRWWWCDFYTPSSHVLFPFLLSLNFLCIYFFNYAIIDAAFAVRPTDRCLILIRGAHTEIVHGVRLQEMSGQIWAECGAVFQGDAKFLARGSCMGAAVHRFLSLTWRIIAKRPLYIGVHQNSHSDNLIIWMCFRGVLFFKSNNYCLRNMRKRLPAV
jgi:hypothetical protein